MQTALMNVTVQDPTTQPTLTPTLVKVTSTLPPLSTTLPTFSTTLPTLSTTLPTLSSILTTDPYKEDKKAQPNPTPNDQTGHLYIESPNVTPESVSQTDENKTSNTDRLSFLLIGVFIVIVFFIVIAVGVSVAVYWR